MTGEQVGKPSDLTEEPSITFNWEKLMSDDKNNNTTKCMCGHTVDNNEVVFINPSTKAITWANGLPYCGSCVPVAAEEI